MSFRFQQRRGLCRCFFFVYGLQDRYGLRFWGILRENQNDNKVLFLNLSQKRLVSVKISSNKLWRLHRNAKIAAISTAFTVHGIAFEL